MNRHVQIEMPKTGERQAYDPIPNELSELIDAELRLVSGGINPQPLPPRAQSTSF
jgi:hypothetical protein